MRRRREALCCVLLAVMWECTAPPSPLLHSPLLLPTVPPPCAHVILYLPPSCAHRPVRTAECGEETRREGEGRGEGRGDKEGREGAGGTISIGEMCSPRHTPSLSPLFLPLQWNFPSASTLKQGKQSERRRGVGVGGRAQYLRQIVTLPPPPQCCAASWPPP